MAGQEELSAGVRNNYFIYDTLYQPNTHALNFH